MFNWWLLFFLNIGDISVSLSLLFSSCNSSCPKKLFFGLYFWIKNPAHPINAKMPTTKNTEENTSLLDLFSGSFSFETDEALGNGSGGGDDDVFSLGGSGAGVLLVLCGEGVSPLEVWGAGVSLVLCGEGVSPLEVWGAGLFSLVCGDGVFPLDGWGAGVSLVLCGEGAFPLDGWVGASPLDIGDGVFPLDGWGAGVSLVLCGEGVSPLDGWGAGKLPGNDGDGFTCTTFCAGEGVGVAGMRGKFDEDGESTDGAVGL